MGHSHMPTSPGQQEWMHECKQPHSRARACETAPQPPVLAAWDRAWAAAELAVSLPEASACRTTGWKAKQRIALSAVALARLSPAEQ